MTTFQVVSDLHLEYSCIYNFEEIVTPSAEVLIVAGDICPVNNPFYTQFIIDCSRVYTHTIIVAGNHEYYGDETMDIVDKKIVEITTKLNNVHYLQRGTWKYRDIVVLGSTLWSLIPKRYQHIAVRRIRDFTCIPGMTPEIYNTTHHETLQWLAHEIQMHNLGDKQIIVVSHHLPSPQCIDPRYEGDPINCIFMADLEYLFGNNLKYWICGHTHTSFDLTIKQTRVIVNPRGYCDENLKYNRELIFTV